jgi:hypothetical protein
MAAFAAVAIAVVRLGRRAAQVAEGRHQQLQHRRGHGLRNAALRQQPRGRFLHQRQLAVEVENGEHRFEVEAALQRRAHLVHAAVARVGGGDDVEALARIEHAVLARELGHRHHAVRQHAQQAVLHLERRARDLLEAHHLALLHAQVQRRRHHGARARAFVDEQRVVPAVLDLVFGDRGAALDGERRDARDGRGQQLRQHRLGRARLAHQHQAAAGGQRDEHALDAGHRRDDLGRDVERRVAEDEERAAFRPSAQPGGRGSLSCACRRASCAAYWISAGGRCSVCVCGAFATVHRCLWSCCWMWPWWVLVESREACTRRACRSRW